MISIIIPAYNSRSTIVEALESIASQTLWSQWAVGPASPRLCRAGSRQLAAQVAAGVSAAEIESAEKEKSLVGTLLRSEGTLLRRVITPNAPLSCPSCASRLASPLSPPDPSYEVIIVDDCSTDDTVAVVEKWIAAKTKAPANDSSSPVWGGCPHPPSSLQADEADGDIRPTRLTPYLLLLAFNISRFTSHLFCYCLKAGTEG